ALLWKNECPGKAVTSSSHFATANGSTTWTHAAAAVDSGAVAIRPLDALSSNRFMHLHVRKTRFHFLRHRLDLFLAQFREHRQRQKFFRTTFRHRERSTLISQESICLLEVHRDRIMNPATDPAL